MAFASATALTQVETVVAAISGLQQVVIGVPASLVGGRVTAYLVLIGGPAGIDATGGHWRAEKRVRVTFAYRTDGDVRAAELAVANAYDAFVRGFHAALLAGTLPQDSTLDPSVSGGAEYALVAGQEFRRLPIDVVFSDYETLG